VLSHTVSTVKKSQAMIPAAWVRRNSDHVGPARRGAGPRPALLTSVLMVVAPTAIPSLRSSPWILTHPQRGFSLARRGMSVRTSQSMGGLPGFIFDR
jgi:hypothetical protein